MADNGDYLCLYRRFFDDFAATVDPSDQLPVKVAGYNLTEEELAGEVIDWTLQYLTQKQCPSSLLAPLAQRVLQETRQMCRKQPAACGFRATDNVYQPLKLMQSVMSVINDLCSRYLDNSLLDSLPAPAVPTSAPPQYAATAVKNTRRKMEDRHVCISDFHGLFGIQDGGAASYYCILDGHAGQDAAIYGASHLHQYLAESPLYPHDPIGALREAFLRTDQAFIEKCEKENLHSGTTAVAALLRERWLYVGWVGDSQALLAKQGRVLQVVRPHKPSREDERQRIEDLGGCVMFYGTWRVSGQLAVSRAIGDRDYKPFVTGEPEVAAVPLDGLEDFLIVACDGLWDFVTEDEAALCVYTWIRENPDEPNIVTQQLVALSKKQGSTDNISVVVVFLRDPQLLAKDPHPVTMDLDIMDRSNSNQLNQSELTTNDFNQQQQQPENNGPPNNDQSKFNNDQSLFNNDESMFNNQFDPFNRFNNQQPGSDDNQHNLPDSNQFVKVNMELDLGLKNADDDIFMCNTNSKRNVNAMEEDLGPETDVDTVDDVAMAIEEIRKEAVDLDIKVDNQFRDDEMREETPTPPIDSALDNIAESDSEDEWNYYRVNQSAKIAERASPLVNKSEQELLDEMASQLNPDAAEFVPISPTCSPVRVSIMEQLLNKDKDMVVAGSPCKLSDASIDNCFIPSENIFDNEAAQRPSDLARPDSPNSGASYQEMNLKEAMHGDEKIENGFDSTPLSELNPFTDSFKPQDPMSMSFYQDRDESSGNPFDVVTSVDMNAVHTLPSDSDEENNGQIEGNKENIGPEDKIEGDLMSPVNEVSSPDAWAPESKKETPVEEAIEKIQNTVSFLGEVSQEVDNVLSTNAFGLSDDASQPFQIVNTEFSDISGTELNENEIIPNNRSQENALLDNVTLSSDVSASPVSHREVSPVNNAFINDSAESDLFSSPESIASTNQEIHDIQNLIQHGLQICVPKPEVEQSLLDYTNEVMEQVGDQVSSTLDSVTKQTDNEITNTENIVIDLISNTDVIHKNSVDEAIPASASVFEAANKLSEEVTNLMEEASRPSEEIACTLIPANEAAPVETQSEVSKVDDYEFIPNKDETELLRQIEFDATETFNLIEPPPPRMCVYPLRPQTANDIIDLPLKEITQEVAKSEHSILQAEQIVEASVSEPANISTDEQMSIVDLCTPQAKENTRPTDQIENIDVTNGTFDHGAAFLDETALCVSKNNITTEQIASVTAAAAAVVTGAAIAAAKTKVGAKKTTAAPKSSKPAPKSTLSTAKQVPASKPVSARVPVTASKTIKSSTVTSAPGNKLGATSKPTTARAPVSPRPLTAVAKVPSRPPVTTKVVEKKPLPSSAALTNGVARPSLASGTKTTTATVRKTTVSPVTGAPKPAVKSSLSAVTAKVSSMRPATAPAGPPKPALARVPLTKTRPPVEKVIKNSTNSETTRANLTATSRHVPRVANLVTSTARKPETKNGPALKTSTKTSTTTTITNRVSKSSSVSGNKTTTKKTIASSKSSVDKPIQNGNGPEIIDLSKSAEPNIVLDSSAD